MPANAPHPFASLTPPGILDALDSLGLRGDGRLLQLNSYENRVYQVMLEDGGAVVAKFYRPERWSDDQIREEHHFAAELLAAEVPVVAPLPLVGLTGHTASEGHNTLGQVQVDGQRFRVAVFPLAAGHAPELESAATLAWLGRFLGRCHAVGARQPFVHRRTLDAGTFGASAIERISDSGLLTAAEAPAWTATAGQALDAVRRAFDACPPATLRLHGDCHPGNILWRPPADGLALEPDAGQSADPVAGPRIVDLDDAVMGPAVQDLWMLLSNEPATLRSQLAALLQGYRQFHPFDTRELALIEPLRTLRMLHHSAWITDRWDDPAFPVAFPWFGTPGYWGQQTMELKEQLAHMAEPPLETFGLD